MRNDPINQSINLPTVGTMRTGIWWDLSQFAEVHCSSHEPRYSRVHTRGCALVFQTHHPLPPIFDQRVTRLTPCQPGDLYTIPIGPVLPPYRASQHSGSLGRGAVTLNDICVLMYAADAIVTVYLFYPF